MACTAVEGGTLKTVSFSGDGTPEDAAGLVGRLQGMLEAGRLEDHDGYSIGGSVGVLEARAAEVFGMEGAIWMPTGTMANMLGLYALTHETGATRVLLPAESHVYNDTGDGVARLLSVQPVPLAPGQACYTAADAAAAIDSGAVGGRVRTAVGAALVESPVRRRWGASLSYHSLLKYGVLCGVLRSRAPCGGGGGPSSRSRR